MKLFNSIKTVASKLKAGGGCHLPLRLLWQQEERLMKGLVFMISATCFLFILAIGHKDDMALKEQQASLRENMQGGIESVEGTEAERDSATTGIVGDSNSTKIPDYQALYEQNNDFAGWLRIEDTVIDYPVMQHLEDENYYLTRGFDREENRNGCLILDNDSNVGVGKAEQQYADGSKPSTNLIIHGHTMKSGQMFGKLSLYEDKEYGMSHNIICFDTLYEKREYELIAVFYSQVYYKSDQVFKYYKFFQADTQEEFDDWYNNIKKMSLYDTGVTAELGDEFITLSACAYHVEDGRFVVVGKRVDN